MASRVNTKFVVILIVAVVVMLGMLFAAYSVVYKTADDLAALGDQALVEGDANLARTLYSKAVNKDPTIVGNIEKWISALEQWTPDTETAYYDAYRNDYLGAIRQASVVQRTNLDAYHRELGISFESLARMYNRGQADQLIRRTTEVLGFFDGIPGVDEGWPTLRRYRGLAWERISASSGVVEDTQYELIRDDLTTALLANPSDDNARSALMRWTVYEQTQTVVNNDKSGVTTARNEAVAMGKMHFEKHPNSPMTLVTALMIEMELARSAAIEAHPINESARTKAVQEALLQFSNQLEDIHNALMSMPDDKLSLSAANNFRLAEYLADPGSGFVRTVELFERMIEANPSSSDLLLSTATIYTSKGERAKAAAVYEQITSLPIPPISIQGYQLFNAQREALISQASMKLDEYQRASLGEDASEEQVAEILGQAIIARDLYAERVTEDNTALMLIDGQIAYAHGETENALRLFKRFIDLNENPRMKARGLWLEAIAAAELNQNGTARTALMSLLDLQQYDIRALLMLANIETKLQDFRTAKSLYQEALNYDPDNRAARAGIVNINAIQDPSLLDNPALELIVRSRGLRRGDADNPGDLSASISVLSEGIASVNYDPGVTRELATVLLDQGDIVGARKLLELAVEANPDDEGIAGLYESVQNDDEFDILISMIRSANTDPIEELVSIASISSARGKFELLDESLEQLVEIAPNDSRVIDLSFVRALALDQTDKAQEIAKNAQTHNSDRVNGLTYQARLASFEGNHQQAIQFYQQAISGGAADSSLYRMLAIEQMVIGQVESSIESFEQALSIRPDDQSSILTYMNALFNKRRYTDALDIARRFQRYANEDSQFMSMWLFLEGDFGGVEGQEYAIRQREKFLELNPNDAQNNFALANLYVATNRWDESRALINDLRASDDKFRYAELEARWYANQGRVGDQDGLLSARQVYLDYIEAHQDEGSATPYIGLAQFMLDRGHHNLAIQAAMDAVSREDPKTLDGTKLLGDLFMRLNQYTNASNAFRKILDAGIDEGDLYRLRLIDMQIRTRQFADARVQFDLLDASKKNTMIALLQSSEIEEGLGNQKEARDLLDQAVANYSDDSVVYVKRAEFLAGSEENLSDMLSDVDAALQINPNDWRAYRVRAAGYFAVDQRTSALRDLQRAVRLNPMLDQALFGIINEFMIDGRNSEAFDFAQEIVSLRSQNASLIDQLGQLFSSRDDWDHATEFYKLAWRAQRTPRAGSTLIDAIVRTRSPDTKLANAVINDLTAIAGQIDASPGLLAAQALVLKARGRDQLAVQQLTKAFDLSSNDDQLLIQWSGNISRYFEGQSMQDQINYLDTLKRRNPNQEVLNWIDLFIAQRLVSAGSQREFAISTYERLILISNQPKLQLITFQSYGTTLYTASEFVKAAEIWVQGTELFPGDWEMSNNLAYVLSAEMGEHERALKLAENAIESNPNRSEPYDTLGNIYTALGQYDKAEEMLNEGMKYTLSVRARITLIIAQININLAKGETEEANAKLLDIRSLLRAIPTRDIGLEQQVDEIEVKIDSAE